jgi:hypothetical protein
LTTDKLEARKSSKQKKDDYLDFSLLHGWFVTRENKESMYIYFFYQESYIIADIQVTWSTLVTWLQELQLASFDHFD